MAEFAINTVGDLREFFTKLYEQAKNCSPSRLVTFCYVSDVVRRNWLLNHNELKVNNKTIQLDFMDQGGGVWKVTMRSTF